MTTLVPQLQAEARKALGTHEGAVVAIDPATGDVLAMYSNPGYDPNRCRPAPTRRSRRRGKP